MSAFSSNPQHLPINAALLDEAVHSDDRTFVDRLGRTRRTIKGIELSVSDALTARDEAVLARDAAIAAAGPLYATIEEGRAAVADGETFAVQGEIAGAIAARFYRRVSDLQSVLIAEIPSSAAIKNESTARQKSNKQFRFARFRGFSDDVQLAVVDKVGRRIDSAALLSKIRQATGQVGQAIFSRYNGFYDSDAFVVVDRFFRPLQSHPEIAPSEEARLWEKPLYVSYSHDAKNLYVAWVHNSSLMLRAQWCPNGHNGLFNFRSLAKASFGDPSIAAWTIIQSTSTDYIPPITHHATTGETSENVTTTGGNHSGVGGEITAFMHDLMFTLDGAPLEKDFSGYATEVIASWRNMLYAGNTINEQRITTKQEVRARFYARNVEVVCKVTALEPIKIWRDGGAQLVGAGYQDAYHFYGGIQQGSIPGGGTVYNGGTKAQAPNCWACVLKSNDLGYMAAWVDRGYGIKMNAITDADTPAAKNVSSYKFYNFVIKNEASQYHMNAGDSYSWRGGYSYAPLDIVGSGLDSGFIFEQNKRLRIAIANSSYSLTGSVKLPQEIMSADFEDIGGIDSIGTNIAFPVYSARAFKEVI